MKILILKPSSLGDIVQALPVLRLLKAHYPDSEIHWWVFAELAELLQGDPDLSGVYLFERRRFAQPRYWSESLQTITSMRSRRFDWVIDLQGLARSGFVAWLAAGELTIGVGDWREGAPALYDLVVPRPSPLTHAVDWYLEVLKALGVPIHWDFAWIPARPGMIERVRGKWDVTAARWVAISPGARWPNKRWPIEYFAELVRQLSAAYDDLHFAILGGQSDRPFGATIAQVNPGRCLDLTGQTSLSEMMEWIRLSELVVSNDTGPMHVAAAMGKPVVSIFGPTEPRRTGPYGQIDRALRIALPCAPCLKSACYFEKPIECLRAIDPAIVVERVKALLPR